MTASGSAATTRPAERELRAEVVVEAPPERVWAALSDLSRMPRWSPELVRMVPLKPGGLRPGQWYVGVNRSGAVVWPTRNVVRRLEPGRALAWETTTSGASWVYELAPEGEDGARTRLSLTRPPLRLTLTAKAFAPLLGGADGHADALERDMRRTLERLSSEVGAAVAP